MQKNISIMFRKTLSVNLLSGTVLTIVLTCIFKEYALIFAAGLITAEFNFLINAAVTNYLLLYKSERYAVPYFFSFIARISAAALIGFIFFTYNMLSAAAYMLGYSSHFIGILIYSYGLNNMEKGSD